jgi:hypothetical protein
MSRDKPIVQGATRGVAKAKTDLQISDLVVVFMISLRALALFKSADLFAALWGFESRARCIMESANGSQAVDAIRKREMKKLRRAAAMSSPPAVIFVDVAAHKQIMPSRITPPRLRRHVGDKSQPQGALLSQGMLLTKAVCMSRGRWPASPARVRHIASTPPRRIWRGRPERCRCSARQCGSACLRRCC